MSIASSRGDSPSGSHVDLPSAWRALRHWALLAGLQGPAALVSQGRDLICRFERALEGVAHPSPLLTGVPRNALLIALIDPSRTLSWPTRQLEYVIPTDPSSSSSWFKSIDARVRLTSPRGDETAWTGDWNTLAKEIEIAGAVSVSVRCSRRTWKHVLRPRISLFAVGAGLVPLDGDERGAQRRFTVDLGRAKAIGWLPTAQDAAALLAACFRLYGLDDRRVTLRLEVTPPRTTTVVHRPTPDGWAATIQGLGWHQPTGQWPSEKECVKLEVIVSPPLVQEAPKTPPVPTVEMAGVREVVLALHKGLQDAPRNFATANVLRDKFLPSTLPAEQRKRMVEAALAAGAIRLTEQIDPAPGAGKVTAVTLVREHGLVREILAAASQLPEPATLKGASLTATVLAARGA